MQTRILRRSWFLLILISLLSSAFTSATSETGHTDKIAAQKAVPADINPAYEWIRFIGTEKNERSFSATADEAGNVYVASNSFDSDTIRIGSVINQIFISKIDADGNLIWQFDLETEPYSAAESILLDGAGNIFVAGTSVDTWGDPIVPYHENGDKYDDFFLAKFNPDGTMLWNTFIGTSQDEFFPLLANSPDGGVYTFGYGADYTQQIFDAPFLAKVNSRGEQEWTQAFGTFSASNNILLILIQTDALGNVYVAGNSDSNWGNPILAPAGMDDCFIAKFDPNGVMLWNSFIGGENNDGPNTLLVDGDGSIYLAGESESSWGEPVYPYTGSMEGFVAKLDPNGNLLWNTFMGEATGEDSVSSLDMDAANNIYLLGYSDQTWGNPIVSRTNSYFLAQINPDGNLLWHSFIEGPTSGYIYEMKSLPNDRLYFYGNATESFGTPINDHAGNYDAFIAKINLKSNPTDAYRDPGPLVPEITRYIPTPLDVSTEPGVIGTNLLLAALLMLPFAVAVDMFSRIFSDNEASLEKFPPVAWITRLQKRTRDFSDARIKRQWLMDILGLLGVALFYGLVFSLLDKTWNPFSVKGLVLFASMAFAFGVVGIFDDILQWWVIRKWKVQGEFSLRPTNMFLAMVSTITSRMLSLVPGLMFGSPEAIRIDGKALTQKQNRTLIQISTFTYLFIGLAAWIPTIATTILQRQDIPETTKNLLGGMEAFLLVIFAVSIENVFVQLLGISEGLGQKMKVWNKWMWVISLTSCAFVFLHTLLNPRYDFLQALQQGNTSTFIEAAAVFILLTFTLNLILRTRKSKKLPEQA
jgi:hypothetical protein